MMYRFSYRCIGLVYDAAARSELALCGVEKNFFLQRSFFFVRLMGGCAIRVLEF